MPFYYDIDKPATNAKHTAINTNKIMVGDDPNRMNTSTYGTIPWEHDESNQYGTINTTSQPIGMLCYETECEICGEQILTPAITITSSSSNHGRSICDVCRTKLRKLIKIFDTEDDIK